MTFGLYGIAVPSDFHRSDVEILVEVGKAFAEDQLVQRVANDHLEHLSEGGSMTTERWRELFRVMHAARRDCGVSPRWTSLCEGVWIQQRIIELATSAQ